MMDLLKALQDFGVSLLNISGFFILRGVKEGNYHVCRETNSKAILVELCFCTSEIDKSKWNAEKIAKGLFKGITGEDYLRDEWVVDDWCKIHGHITHYVTGDVIAPHGYEYKIVDIQEDNVFLEYANYKPQMVVKKSDIYR